MKLKALSVSKVNEYIKRLLTNDPILYNLRVEGEISNFKIHSSGNVYFSIKDESSKINSIMFKSSAANNVVDIKTIKDGDKVIVSGHISVYEKDGSYQLYAKSIELMGLGDLYKEFIYLKEKLEKKGYFEQSNKKKIARFPTKIGIVTSPTGAAIKDMINVIGRRYPKVEIKLFSALVQGENAYKDIIDGIKYFNKEDLVDTIIIGRGGGSIEELWAFNNEDLAKTIFESKVPIISAVGHETDYTISDFVSDLRAPTPSAAGELAVPSLEDIVFKLENQKYKLITSLKNHLKRNELNLKNQELRIKSKDILKLKQKTISLDYQYEKLTKAMDLIINLKKSDFLQKAQILENLSPLSTLSRGYCIAKDNKNKLIKSIYDINKGSHLDLRLKDGSLSCIVEDIIEVGETYEDR